METRAKYVVVGSFVLGVAGLILGFAFWLGIAGLTERGDRYLLYFESAVTGLDVGSSVRYRGIPVGQVRSIEIDPTDIERVRVLIEVESGTPLRDDSVGTLQISGLTGGSFVQISGGTQDAPAPRQPPGEAYPVIASQPSTLDSLTEQAPDLLDRLIILTDRASAILSEENREAVTNILANAESVSADLADQAEVLAETNERIGALMTNFDGFVTEIRVDLARASDRFDSILGSVNAGIDLFLSEADATSEAARQVLASAENAAATIDGLISTAGPGLEDFANTGLYEFSVMTTELRELARNMSRILERIERNPAQFFLGPRGQTGVPVER